MMGETEQTRIRTPDQRLRVFVSSTLGELADERRAERRAVEQLRLAPIMFELGARPHPPRALYRSYLEQSEVFVGVYWQRYGWVAPDMDISGPELHPGTLQVASKRSTKGSSCASGCRLHLSFGRRC